mmetsp:Transcript_6113/g.12129  ORF Transcript_6113/g.12129 Transcript_6113/m.12129 type:complete len:238 (-) Transcript_6113:527-1240(-)
MLCKNPETPQLFSLLLVWSSLTRCSKGLSFACNLRLSVTSFTRDSNCFCWPVSTKPCAKSCSLALCACAACGCGPRWLANVRPEVICTIHSTMEKREPWPAGKGNPWSPKQDLTLAKSSSSDPEKITRPWFSISSSSKSPKANAEGECTAATTVRPSSRASCCRNRITSLAMWESSPVVGSSRNKTEGVPISARAMFVRLAWPPEIPRLRREPMIVCWQSVRARRASTSSTMLTMDA